MPKKLYSVTFAVGGELRFRWRPRLVRRRGVDGVVLLWLGLGLTFSAEAP